MKNIAWYNRPWNKIRTKGISSLDDAELLSVILVRGNKEHNVLEISNKLLSEFNLNYPISLSKVKSILKDDVKAFQIVAIGELMKRYRKLMRKGYSTNIRKAEDVFNIFVEELRDKKKEHLYGVLLNSQNRVIKKILISIGTLNSSLIHPREVFKQAIMESANSIILVHNHPSGDPTPSDEDREITKILLRCSELLNIKLLDHVIVADDSWRSII